MKLKMTAKIYYWLGWCYKMEKDDLANKIILNIYYEALSNGVIPSVNFILKECLIKSETECLDIIYDIKPKEIFNCEKIHSLLCVNQSIHKYDGDIFFDAQNVLFKNWLPYQGLLV